MILCKSFDNRGEVFIRILTRRPIYNGSTKRIRYLIFITKNLSLQQFCTLIVYMQQLDMLWYSI